MGEAAPRTVCTGEVTGGVFPRLVAPAKVTGWGAEGSRHLGCWDIAYHAFYTGALRNSARTSISVTGQVSDLGGTA